MHKPLKFSIWFSVIIAAVFVVAWLWIRESSVPGPYDTEPVSIVRNGNGVGSAPSEVASWQTYRNEKYGYKYGGRLLYYVFLYPKDWIYNDGPGGVIARSLDNKCSISIGGGVASRGTFGYSVFGERMVNTTGRMVNLLVLKNENQNLAEKYWAGIGLDNGIEASISINMNDPSLCLDIFDQILSTFKFLE